MNKSIYFVLKCDLKEESRKKRIEGMSFRDIAKELSISASSARNYTKDINLTKEQKEKLLSYRRKKTNKVIVLSYKNDNIIIKGKIKINYPSKNNNPNIKKMIIHLIENSVF